MVKAAELCQPSLWGGSLWESLSRGTSIIKHRLPWNYTMVESVLSWGLLKQMRNSAEVSRAGQDWSCALDTCLWYLVSSCWAVPLAVWRDPWQRVHGTHLKTEMPRLLGIFPTKGGCPEIISIWQHTVKTHERPQLPMEITWKAGSWLHGGQRTHLGPEGPWALAGSGRASPSPSLAAAAGSGGKRVKHPCGSRTFATS